MKPREVGLWRHFFANAASVATRAAELKGGGPAEKETAGDAYGDEVAAGTANPGCCA